MSVGGQAAVVRQAISAAGVDPETITYVEGHGTATTMGDPVEILALTKAFAAEKRQFCALGAVKTNVGHLSWSAGMVGLIKTILALEHRQIPASLHFERPNPRVDIEQSPFYVNTRLSSTRRPSGARASTRSPILTQHCSPSSARSPGPGRRGGSSPISSWDTAPASTLRPASPESSALRTGSA